MKLIDNVEHWWKLWSLRLAAVGTAVTSYLVMFPDQAIAVWAMMPDDLKALLPAKFAPMIGVAIFASSMIARVIKQKNVSSSQ